jgi:hypothetical protein
MASPTKSTASASVRIDGKEVDPCHVIATTMEDGSHHDIEVCIGVKMLVHELQQCGVAVSEANLCEFAAADARSEKGRHGYLTISRYVIARLQQLSGDRYTITPRWIWTETRDVVVRDKVIRFVGKCVEQLQDSPASDH